MLKRIASTIVVSTLRLQRLRKHNLVLELWAWAAACVTCVICMLMVCALEANLTRPGGRAYVLSASCARALLHLLHQLDGRRFVLMRAGTQCTGQFRINFAA